ncbi:sensor histidine kinase [Actinomyces sp.]|uniref:sensor histidine kinase n=1 Tax=Actinomyces sp. TaxID=29317 RepID=UPI0026DB2611|nr:histidine kinase [Actinomyces sp.]MDO4899234.1 histidine kinase [Actinomyces sp.]
MTGTDNTDQQAPPVRVSPTGDPAVPVASTAVPAPTALDWRRHCRLTGPARFRVPLSDAVLTALLAVVVLADFTLVSTWGAHPAYVANTLIALVVTAAQPLRHRSPVISGVIVYLAMVAYVALLRFTPVNLGLSPVIVAVPTALHALTRWAPDRRWGVGALLATLVGAVINPHTLYAVNPHTAHMFDYPPFGLALACVLVVASTYLWALRCRTAAESLDRAVAEAARLATTRAVSAERLAIARELHDLVGHGLTAVKVQADAGLTLGTPDAVLKSLTTVRDVAADALSSTHELVALLRSSAVQTTTQRTLVPVADLTGLPDLVERARSTGLRVDATLPPRSELAAWNSSWTALQRLTLNRVVTEGLANAARHGAGTARLTVAEHDGWCRVRVINPLSEGEGATAASESNDREYGFGLTGMAERLRLVGGRLEAGAYDDAGTCFLLDAVFPAAFPPDSPTSPVVG